MKKKFIKYLFPTSVVRQAERLFSEEPMLNVNCYWIGVNALAFDERYEGEISDILSREIPKTSIFRSELS